MDKRIASASDEVIITNDGATILNKMEVLQPATKKLAVPFPLLPPSTPDSFSVPGGPKPPTATSVSAQMLAFADLERIRHIDNSSDDTDWMVRHRPTDQIYALKVIHGNHEDTVRHRICRRDRDSPRVHGRRHPQRLPHPLRAHPRRPRPGLLLPPISPSSLPLPRSRPSIAASSHSPSAVVHHRCRRISTIRARIREIFMPALSSTMMEGKIVSWVKAEGDRLSKGESIVVVESDKVNMDVETFYDGSLMTIIVLESETAPVGAPISLIEFEDEVPLAKAHAQSQSQVQSHSSSPPPPSSPPSSH